MTVFEQADAALLPGFERRTLHVHGQDIRVLTGGKGPALLMLHGDPQTHLCWHHVAPELARTYHVVLPDIRGRGETHKPGIVPGGNAYSKRAMAAEQREVMRLLGHNRFRLVGHDRGARVARRLALDFPEAVEKLVVMDIVPALDLYENMTAEVAQDYFYFSFLTQPFPLPETLIAGNPEAFLRGILLGLSDKPVEYDPQALACYLAANSTPAAITAMCECFRAGFHVDRQHDREDRAAGRSIVCPTLVLWGEKGVIGRHFDIRGIWSSWCELPSFQSVDAGHFIPEEAPDVTAEVLSGFLALG